MLAVQEIKSRVFHTESLEANENLTYHHTFRVKKKTQHIVNMSVGHTLSLTFFCKKNSSSAVFLLIRVWRLHTISIGFFDDDNNNNDFLYGY